MQAMRTTPLAHQSEALRRVAAKPTNPSSEDVFAWLMDMGTGKTWVSLAEWGERVLAGELDDLLVVAPAGSYGNWCVTRDPESPSEMERHLSPELFDRTVVAQWVSGGRVRDKRAIDSLMRVRGRPRALVVNVESLSSVKAAREACEAFLAGGRCMMVIDESTRIKNPSAKRTKYISDRLAPLAASRRIATGLLAPRSPMDVYSQFEFLDWRILGFKSWYAFRARYAILRRMEFGGRSVQVEVGYRNVDELQQKIDRYSYRVLKEDCLDLEPKVYTTRDVALTPEQEKMYNEMRHFATARIADEDYVTATAVITQIQRLHQILCGFAIDEQGALHPVKENRTESLLEVLDEHRGKAIIWTGYDYTVRSIADRLEKEYGEGSVARFWGGNRSTRAEDEARFKTDPKCRFMVATPAAGGVGNTWTVADLVVYYSNTYDLELRSQSEDRAHRSGQTKSVTYVDLIARGTVDEKIIKALRAKINMSTAITGENYREWLI